MKIKIAQVYRVEKWITIDVEGDTLEEAIETYQSGETPPSSDPRWDDYWSMENEEITEVEEYHGRLEWLVPVQLFQGQGPRRAQRRQR